MNEYTIVTGTVTSAIKGRDTLKKNGIYAEIERLSVSDRKYGCGYAIKSRGDYEKIKEFLSMANVKIIKIL